MEGRALASACGQNVANVWNVGETERSDRRIERTRRDVLSSLNHLVLERGYDDVSVRDITERANVGRSTFYEHFASKADVLRESLVAVLTPCADAVSPACAVARLEDALQHFWAVRGTAGTILTGAARALVAETLADLIEERLRQRVAAQTSAVGRLPVAIVARALAETQLGLIGAWLGGSVAGEAHAVARAVHTSAKTSAAAMLCA